MAEHILKNRRAICCSIPNSDITIISYLHTFTSPTPSLFAAEGLPVGQILFSKTAPALHAAGGAGSVAVLLLERAGSSAELSEDTPDGFNTADTASQAGRLEACIQANTSKRNCTSG